MKPYEVVANTKDMERNEWLEQRQKGIGGSDVSAIAGLNRYKSAFALYLEKTESVKYDEAGEAAYWGNIMEPIVAEEFSKRTGLKVRRKNQLLKHKDYPFMMANLDRVIVGKNQLLECKTASEWFNSDWDGEEIPAPYLLQITHYMAVTGAEGAWIAVLVGGNKFRYKYVERDEELIEYVIELEKDFWENNVLAKVPPAIDGSDSAKELLKKMYPVATVEEAIDLEDDVDELILKHEELKQQEKEIKKESSRIENDIKLRLGEHDKGMTSKNLVTWSTVVSKRVDSKALKADFPEVYEQVIKESSSRRFGYKQIKGDK